MKQLHKTLLILFVLTLNMQYIKAQEINCRIQVNSSQIQGTDKSIFQELQKGLFELINNYSWTSHVYSMEERIECSFLLNLTKAVSADEFKGTLQVTSSRPVYKSGYSSPLINLVDKSIQFSYVEGQSLDFSENTHSELTSLFAYYIYIIIGLDYDSFSNLGGTPYFEKAEKIVTAAQTSQYTGWKSYENRKNRYWLVENFLNSTYKPIREYSYIYHRLALDIMYEKPVDGRASIASDLSPLLKLHRQKPSSYIMQVFFDTKSDEFVNILSESYASEGTRAYNILKEIDPGHMSKYEKIIKKD